jgi:dihydrofolate reductase
LNIFPQRLVLREYILILCMRKIILDLAVTLDGFIEGPNGEIDWLELDHGVDFADILSDIIKGVDSVFYGRVSYEKWGHYHPGDSGGLKLKQAYDRLHSLDKYVFSSQLAEDGKATVIRSDIKERVEELKNQPGGDIWLYGGGKLITTFINLDLVDVYRLAVHPVILGQGKPLFDNIKNRVNLKLDSSQSWPSGVVLLKYFVDRAG